MASSVKKNSLYSIIKTGSSILFPLITFPYISRVLLTDNVGKIQYGLSIVSYFALIASLGISTYAIRECSGIRNDKSKLSKNASEIYSINIIFTIIAYVALAITLIFLRKLDNYRTLIVIQSVTIVATTLGADWLNSAMEDFKYITLRTVFFQVCSLVLMFIFVKQEEDYMKYAVICVLSSAGANITNIWYRRNRYCKMGFTLHIDWKRHMEPIIYLFVMVLAQTIFNSVDSTMLGSMHGDFEVGIYAAAHKILNIINQVVGSLLWVIMPRMAYYFAEGDYDNINRLLRKVLQFNITLGLPCIVGTITLSGDIIRVVAGDAFIAGAPVLQILMLGFIFSLVGGSFLGNAVLLPSKQEKYYMIVCCISAIINIILNYLMIPYWGARAAAGTTAVCSIIILVLLLFRVDKRIHLEKIYPIIISAVLGCCGIVGICLLCKNINNLYIRTFLSIGLSGIVYMIIQIICKNALVLELLQMVKNKLTGQIHRKRQNSEE